MFGFGLSGFIPLFIYIGCIIAIAASIMYRPVIGALYMFPLLPYRNIFEKIKIFPLGKDIYDILFIAIFIGWFIRRNEYSEEFGHYDVLSTKLQRSVMFLVIAGFISFIVGSIFGGLSFDFENTLLQDWKNYVCLPLIWFLVVNTVKDKKVIILMTILMLIGILGADRYFQNTLSWMNLSHFSYRTRSMMTGLFVYLGPNEHGAFFAHYIFLPLGLLMFTKSKVKKLMLFGLIAFTVYCLVYTYSRGAYVGLIAGIIFLGLVKDKRILLIVLLFFIFWKSLVPLSVVERIEMTQTEEGELESSAGTRVELWAVAFDMFLKSPIFGMGFNTFRARGFTDAHNFYMKMLAEQGLLGFLAFLLVLYYSFKVGWVLYRDSEDDFYRGLGLGFCACVIATALTNMFGDRWSYIQLGAYYWIYLGLVTRANIININQEYEELAA